MDGWIYERIGDWIPTQMDKEENISSLLYYSTYTNDLVLNIPVFLITGIY